MYKKIVLWLSQLLTTRNRSINMPKYDQEYMTLGLVMESKDELDTEIINSTITMILGLNLNNIVFKDKKTWEDYFKKVLNLTKNLLKANEHYRKYYKEEEIFLREYKKKCLKNSNTNVFLTTDPVSLNTEIDGFLSQIKSALDTLATTMNPLLGFNLNGWHKNKDKDGIKKSGTRIVNSIENLPEFLKNKAKGLKKHIENNVDGITYIVNLRDKVHHSGGLKSITDITYDFRNKEVISQYIIHSEGKELVKNFLLRTLKDIVLFFNDTLILSILIKTPSGMCIRKNNKKDFPPYNWFAY
ncbi:MAG: hypothetical protein A3I89_01435 [Candidatus Harrisonbacteria bacterium RIFCSPLOWO2_02_FULL_41_11]|uniref:Uncharacterized protein n=1 Tax=Candidatus Harrisonbacteria bacterium RIFCSPHIGHO2_02_FULL_42_16 TaxID=1798404 RepID=A0A1G1ZFE7_9BACT|nr:MAG: hypothetical protein A3B92_04055 [Candidatus Harrisonbacteria bacterium RIFCSPHIGHO2_02_FULL_42_16]OGY66718.1 MAG: hypothetical protein A3I89_01435 [Candidatus Harrisonbacteria bacterium RIFCSPLOWO2_02_FULL_41_11]